MVLTLGRPGSPLGEMVEALKEEWGVSGGGGAYQGALNELREIQKTIARRALVG